MIQAIPLLLDTPARPGEATPHPSARRPRNFAVFGRPEWFDRLPGGWGLRPRTWQGWAYLFAFLTLQVAIAVHLEPGRTRDLLAGPLSIAFLVDAFLIWTRLPNRSA